MTKINLKEYVKSKLQIKQKPVSIFWQIFAVFVPFGWIWASYRIGELRQGVLIFFIMPVVSGVILQTMIPVSNTSIVLIVIFTAIQIFFIYKWSTGWNARFN